MGALSCLCLSLPKRAPDGSGDLELKTACEREAAPRTLKEAERWVIERLNSTVP